MKIQCIASATLALGGAGVPVTSMKTNLLARLTHEGSVALLPLGILHGRRTAAGSTLSTAPITTPPAASAKAPRPNIFWS
jgi:hypothetical protein